MTTKKQIDTHRPLHIFLDDTYYFITLSTFHRQPFFDTDQKKSLIQQTLTDACNTYKYDLTAWVILNNHCHFELKVNNSLLLPKFIRSIEGKSAIELNKLLATPGIKRWYQYWDECVEDEKGFWMRFNYIHHNPVKHGYVKKMKDYKFSSYNYYLLKYGKEWLSSCFEQYPIVSFTTTDDF
jgi:putative transposase